MPFGLFSLSIGIAADDPSLAAVTTPGLVPGTLGLPLSTRLARSTDMASMESTGRGKSRLGTFGQPWNGHLSCAELRLGPLQQRNRVVLGDMVRWQLLSTN